MRFCPQCGAPLLAAAKFCVECGACLEPAAAASDSPPTSPARAARIPPLFVGVLGGIVLLGFGAAALILRQVPQREQILAVANSNQPGQSRLPQGHPPIKLPKEALDFIAKLKQQADSSPNDIAIWDRLGNVMLRAAMFDPSYYGQATEAYRHVLKLAPDNTDALRGIGNTNYDLHKYDEAIAAYEHYLQQKPDDADVLTDLGTMYLSSGNAEQAVLQYKKALLAKPDFFQAYYNLGVAYGQENRIADARTSFQQALALAPDDKSRERVKETLASLDTGGAAETRSAGNEASSAPRAPVMASTFRDSVDQMVRALPIAGPKVRSVEWPAQDHPKLLMDNFPMDSMPPFARARFISDLKSAVADVMHAYKVQGPVAVDIADGTSGRVMQTVTVDGVESGTQAAPPPGRAQRPAPPPSGASGSFHSAIDQMVRGLPIAGSKVESVQWPSTLRAKLLMGNFPMDSMPPFARAKFIDDLKSGIRNAKAANRITGRVEVDIEDAASARVMQSVSE